MLSELGRMDQPSANLGFFTADQRVQAVKIIATFRTDLEKWGLEMTKD